MGGNGKSTVLDLPSLKPLSGAGPGRLLRPGLLLTSKHYFEQRSNATDQTGVADSLVLSMVGQM